MICAACRDHRHGECRGGSWCDCQHSPSPATPEERRRRDEAPAEAPAEAADEAADRADERPPRAAEPGVNWRRQG
ncbi:hypothetical protein Arub01_24290 [Actinomadura rubrobrunea]|uniref:Uncharacterized protein n=1 Tax=Actinomadura rubrobrunea TaxID=115335 RepID=A0A9W6PUT1_9ACTN|nr:hypothetical protein [Actinomadura rubrobrunea]GLW64185.1 hypothetical protein Arub01_24290 [Actinomadura rubrobrunea]